MELFCKLWDGTISEITSFEVSGKVVNKSAASRLPSVVLISIIALQEKHFTEPL
jgi:hypothetical protein